MFPGDLLAGGVELVPLVQHRHLFAGHDAAARDHAHLAGEGDAGLVLVGGEEVGVFAQLGDLLGMDEQHLVGAAHLLLEQVHRVHDAVVGDGGGGAVKQQGGGLEGVHAVVVDFGGDGHGQLGVGLAHRVAVAGQHRLISETDALHGLLDGGLAGGGGHFLDGHLAALGHIGGVTDVGVGGHRDGVAGHAGQRVVDFGEGGHPQLFGDAGGDHVRHDFRVNEVVQLGDEISHSLLLLFCLCL